MLFSSSTFLQEELNNLMSSFLTEAPMPRMKNHVSSATTSQMMFPPGASDSFFATPLPRKSGPTSFHAFFASGFSETNNTNIGAKPAGKHGGPKITSFCCKGLKEYPNGCMAKDEDHCKALHGNYTAGKCPGDAKDVCPEKLDEK